MSNQGVLNCYFFKSLLQEYAQKVGIPTPVYETIKEGPSHQPFFRSTVIVDDVRYDSLVGFFNRKAAEQSAAEVALMELGNKGKLNDGLSQPVQETGLCKNLLQEYAQNMNYAIPVYVCTRIEIQGKVANFSCTVEIGGMKYIGGAAKTKKEAEIKAARTALFAIKSNPSCSREIPAGNPVYTVIPSQKKGTDPAIITQKILKPKKRMFKKKRERKRHDGEKSKPVQFENMGQLGLGVDIGGQGTGTMVNPEYNGIGGESGNEKCVMAYCDNTVSKNKEIPGIDLGNSATCQGEVPKAADGLNLTARGGCSAVSDRE